MVVHGSAEISQRSVEIVRQIDKARSYLDGCQLFCV